VSTDDFSENKPNLPSHIAYSVEAGKDDKSHWHKIGAAWPTKGDGLNLQLTAIPLDGNIVLRSRDELEKMRSEREAQASTTQQPAPRQTIKR
jgi:hypothetical protein